MQKREREPKPPLQDFNTNLPNVHYVVGHVPSWKLDWLTITHICLPRCNVKETYAGSNNATLASPTNACVKIFSCSLAQKVIAWLDCRESVQSQPNWSDRKFRGRSMIETTFVDLYTHNVQFRQMSHGFLISVQDEIKHSTTTPKSCEHAVHIKMFFNFFPPRTHTSTSRSRVHAQTTPNKQPRAHLHAASPAKRKSCSTSWSAGVVPSAPRVPGSSSMDDATAHAVVQERREPQRRRHACWTRLRNK